MKKYIKNIASALCVAAAACSLSGLTGCTLFDMIFDNRSDTEKINDLADELAVELMGNDLFGWNAFSATPKESYGYERRGEPSWYSYTKVSSNDMKMTARYLESLSSELRDIDKAGLSERDQSTYRSLEYTLNYLYEIYGSEYAIDWDLIGSSYINSYGGYVADFATSFENYHFRSKADFDDLLTVTRSTDDAFASYLTYAHDRVDAGYPLYDYSILAMQEYLNDVLEDGDEFYLYQLVENKINAAEFLSESEKADYVAQFKSALDSDFMKGVQTLATGLDEVKGNVKMSDQSYLAAYGDVGKEYYEWKFYQLTGEKDVNIRSLYNKLMYEYRKTALAQQELAASVEALAETDPDVYDEYNLYESGEKVMLDLSEPQDIMNYLKGAATAIVPDLQTMPEITFKYMDETVAGISNALAYYLLSPYDEQGSVESVTLNGKLIGESSTNLLTLLAHEGYPGHLYAHVNAKEKGAKLIDALAKSTAFSEGWAKYTEVAVLDHIIDTTENAALKLYAQNSIYYEYSGYLSSLLMEMQVNYFGYTANDYVGMGYSLGEAREVIEAFMEDPAVYVPYGYGMYVMVTLHNDAKNALGDKYNEVEFNGRLLGETEAPSIPRAKEIAEEYIAEKKQA